MKWPRLRRPTDSAPDGSTAGTGHKPGRLRRLFRLRRLVLLAVVLPIGIVVARLASAPYDSVWLGQLAAKRLAESSRGASVSIDSVRIDFSGKAIAPLTLLDTAVQTPDGSAQVIIPEIRMETSLSGLFTGNFRVGTVLLVRPEIIVTSRETIGEDGISDETISKVPSGAEVASRIDAALGAAAADFAKFGVDSIQVDDATLDFAGAVLRRFSTIDMELAPTDDGRHMRLDASVAGRAGRWNIRFRNGDEEKGDGRWFSLSAGDVTVADFLPEDFDVQPGRGFGLPLFPRAMFHMDKDGKFKRGDIRLGVGAGFISLKEEGGIIIDEMLLALSWSPDHPQLVLEPSYAIFGDTRIAVHGEIQPPDGKRDTWQFALEVPQAQLKPRDVSGPPLIVDRALAFGSFDPAHMLINLDTFNLNAGTTSVTAAGNIQFNSDGPLAAIAVSSSDVTVSGVKRLWPAMAAPEARDWFVRHAQGGRVRDFRLIVALDPLGFDGDPATVGWEPEGLRLDFLLENGSIKTIGGLPGLTDMVGTGTIRDGGFALKIDEAKTVAPGGDVVDLSGAQFAIPDLRPVVKEGRLDLRLRGSAADIARIAEQEPVNGRSRIDIDPDNLSGKADVSVSVSFPVRRREEPVRTDEVLWTFAADLSDFSSSRPIDGQTIRDADLQVTANPSMATLRGNGLLNGLPVEIDLEQPLDGAGGDGNQGVVLDFDAGDLAGRGFDLGGLVDGKLRLNLKNAENGVRHVVADLTQSTLRLPGVGWTKGVGVPASARFTVRETDKGQEVDDFLLTSDGVHIEGSLSLDKKGGLRDADFERFALRKDDSGRLSVSRSESGYEVDLVASSFDGRGLIANMKRAGDATEGEGDLADEGTFTVKARIDRLTGFHNTTITSFVLDLTEQYGSATSSDMSGLIDGRSDFSAVLSTEGGQRKLRMETGDAGGLFRFADLYERLKGGRGVLTMDLPAESRAVGRLVVTDLAIADDPTLKKIVASDPALVGRESRPIARDRVLNRGEMSFQKLDLRFTKIGQLVRVESGALRGPVLGGAVDGEMNLATQQMNLKGTFVPAYAVNNLFGQIPVLGQLMGGRNGGLLGVTFRVTGSLDNPIISVNPMSAIAPGIFRKIFE
ncbi:AsmA-like C-terminal domain-containing protein [Breoghania sp.]|uniref:YhdP family protein n=1 Tax=Breoghania sp. TaxID=2065378 RepID=UPI002AA8BB84|nr:AsmA-like C-terminal domain-containing protein [Breoghania sp.]